jgi:hypothetical protein
MILLWHTTVAAAAVHVCPYPVVVVCTATAAASLVHPWQGEFSFTAVQNVLCPCTRTHTQPRAQQAVLLLRQRCRRPCDILVIDKELSAYMLAGTLIRAPQLLLSAVAALSGAGLCHGNPDGSQGLPTKPPCWNSSSMPHTAAYTASCLHADKTLTSNHLPLLLLLLSAVFCYRCSTMSPAY